MGKGVAASPGISWPQSADPMLRHKPFFGEQQSQPRCLNSSQEQESKAKTGMEGLSSQPRGPLAHPVLLVLIVILCRCKYERDFSHRLTASFLVPECSLLHPPHSTHTQHSDIVTVQIFLGPGKPVAEPASPLSQPILPALDGSSQLGGTHRSHL